MKISKIESLCKNAKRIMIFNTPTVQWISDGHALYPLYGLPKLEANNIFVIFDIPEDKRGKIYFDEHRELPSRLDISDSTENEREIMPEGVTLIYYGKTLLPIRGSQGIIFLDKKYLEPFGDLKHGYTLFERVFSDGRSYVAVKDGMLLAGLILPESIANATLADMLVNIGELTAVAAENRDSEEIDLTQSEEE